MREILIDVDGVAADFTQALIDAVDSDFDPRNQLDWNIFSYFTEEQSDRAHDVLSDTDFWRSLPLIEGAKDGVKYLETMGYEISWVTSPWESCFGWESARRDWLNEHFNMEQHHHHYIPTSSKHKVVGDVIIDDKPQNVEGWALAHRSGKAFLFDAPYNQDSAWPHRIRWEILRSVL